ncbi:hypothetical protein AMJ57_00520 [Parcubacteria bacterium SG8_24]|nr:MAG: hypothetical protein AMJ57_00520 [Parcubacteria bacterium SG8_24]
MLERREFKRKFMIRLLASPLTLIPLLGGATLLIAQWAFGFASGPLAFVGLTGVLAGIGSCVTRFLTGSERVGREVLDELERETERGRQRALDDLGTRLQGDGDPRTERLLGDLRELTRAFKEDDSWSADVGTLSSFDIISGVDRLFQGCVRALERSVRLAETAGRLNVPEARRSILDKRERLIAEVGKSVERLGGILVQVQALSVEKDSDSSALQELRDELDRNLEVARKVEEQISSWNVDISEYERQAVEGR